ncbi:hypothetical protein [Actinokineospora pegani]|uniref:hypothetical protein n=1 Tax=Actinokineospora pegani TaxID=2654637 RepID=UPI0012E9DA48|nr:hypothetical protein [Actinokineospora pegani]
MAGVEEIRAGIQLSNRQAEASIAAINEAAMRLDEARNALLNATQGSSQAEVSQSHGMLAEALQTLQGVQSTIRSSIASVEGYAARL